MLEIESAALTDVGQKRKGNEDSYFLDDALRLYVVADGMGGHKAGEVASRLVADTLRDYLARFGQGGDVEELEDSDASLSKTANRLLAGIHLANKVVHQMAEGNPAYQGMGSTVSAVSFADGNLVVANVGDSPVYLVREGRITLQSKMHTFMAEQEAIAPEGARKLSEQFRHMLTRAMGTKPEVQPDAAEVPCRAGDVVVISSDGLTDMVKPDEIRQVVVKARPERACRLLVDLANKRGGHDNITVIVLRIKKAPAATPAAAAPAAGPPGAPPPERTVDFDTEDHSYRGVVRRLDAQQVVIETADPVGMDEEVMVSFTLPDGAGSLTVPGEVVDRSGAGITVRFAPPLDDAQKGRLAPLFD